jgi:GT2 family glycosyltransferase
MFLNPDTIVRGGAIRALVDFMDSHQRVGIAGSRLENAEGAAECSAHIAPSPLGELESGARLGILSRALHRYTVSPPMREAAHQCDWVSGASLIVRRKVFEEIGALDEGYFLYFEEVDFCLRAQKAGWRIWFVPESRVVHLEGASTGIRNIVRRRPQYWTTRRRYFVKFRHARPILANALGCGQDVPNVAPHVAAWFQRERAGSKWFAFESSGATAIVFTGTIRDIVSGPG